MTRFTADHACVLLSLVRETVPLVQCLTNAVVTNFTANAMLALGAAPAMTDIPIEADQFARVASATLVNLGTPHAEQRVGGKQHGPPTRSGRRGFSIPSLSGSCRSARNWPPSC